VTGALRGSVVAFQVDSWSGEDHIGWSVTVVGPSRVISKADEVQRLEELRLSSRPRTADRCYIAVRIDLVKGWRMIPGTAPGMPAPLDPTDL
jgi:uncharacterized protein